MTTSRQTPGPPDPELHVVAGVSSGHTYETPLTLGPDADHADHADDPIRDDDDAPTTQPSAVTPAAGGLGDEQA
jgi:hypothetical protein